MKIAVTHENGQIFQHFGHTEQFKVYTVENGKITDTTVVDTNGQGHGALPQKRDLWNRHNKLNDGQNSIFATNTNQFNVLNFNGTSSSFIR